MSNIYKTLRQERLIANNASLSTFTANEFTKELIKHNSSNNPIEKAIQVGIQAPTGTQFKINNCDSILTVGKTGIFEWTLEDTGAYITSFYFLGTPVANKNYIVDFYLEASQS